MDFQLANNNVSGNTVDMSTKQKKSQEKKVRQGGNRSGTQRVTSAHQDAHKIRIVYEDDDILVVHKPRFIACHPSTSHTKDTLVQQVIGHLGGDRELLSNLDCTPEVDRPGIVHRIDWQTSGLLIMAKNTAAHLNLKEQFQKHTIKRTYYCLTHNHFRDAQGVIDVSIGRHHSNPSKRVPLTDALTKKKQTFKDAFTKYKVLQLFTDGSGRNKYSLVRCNLKTGRTHQIRVHLTHVGRPLVGDKLYGSKKQPFQQGAQVLHAKSLGFVHPTTGKEMSFDSELPSYFAEILKGLKEVKVDDRDIL